MLQIIKQKLNPMNYITEAKDIYESFYPLYVVSSIFCLAPYRQERLTNGKVRYKLDYKSIFMYSIVVVLFVIFVIYLTFFQNPGAMEGGMEAMMQQLGGALCGLLAVVEIIFGCVFSKKLTQIVIGIDDVEVILKSLSLPVTYK